MFETIVDFYEQHEWLRWILFLPLTFGLQIAALFLLVMVNSDIAHWAIFRYFAVPAVAGALTMLLLRSLAPRWPSFFCWVFITLSGLGLLCGIVNLAIGIAGEYGVGETVGAGVWCLSAFFCNRHLAKNPA